MCEPATMVAMYGAFQSAKFEEGVANTNARLAEAQAGNAEQRGAAEAGRARMEASQIISQQKVALASGGVDTSSGSAVGLFSDTRAASEQDALTAKSNAAMEAWGHRVQKEELKTRAKIAKRNSVLGPLSIGLSGASDSAKVLMGMG